jgi:hypothetical protein
MTTVEKRYGLLLLFFVGNSLLPAVLFVVLGGRLPSFLLGEDGLYESGAASACLGGSLVFLFAFLKYPRKVDYFLLGPRRDLAPILLGMMLFVMFLEEISWGQRLMGLSVPRAIADNNFQGELNLHNLTVIQNQNNSMSEVFFKLLGDYLLTLPLLVCTFPTARRIVTRLGLPVASLQIALFSVLVRQLNLISYEIVYRDGYTADIHHIGEIRESNVECLLLVLAVEYLALGLREQKKKCEISGITSQIGRGHPLAE